jgi:molybdopterin synthase catalytic subunit
MHIELRAAGFDPLEALRRYQEGMGRSGRFGAMASFVGTMRDFNVGDAVCSMVLEHYPGMTERHLEVIGAEARRQWDLLDGLIVHRVGEVYPGDPIVLVAVWSAHRAAAFDACRYVMEELKSRAPFWKKEALEQGVRWVDKNTPG